MGCNPWALGVIRHTALGHQQFANRGEVFEIDASGRARFHRS